MTATARLSSDGTRVLCCMIDCGFGLAWVLEPDKHFLEQERFVWFPPGWGWQRDGIWTVSARARRRLRQGRTPQAESTLSGHLVEGPTGWIPYLPATARCACGMRQTVDADALGVRHVVPTAGRSACGAPGCHHAVEQKVKDGLLVTPYFCQSHEGEAAHHPADRLEAGYARVLVSRDGLERWGREPLRFQ